MITVLGNDRERLKFRRGKYKTPRFRYGRRTKTSSATSIRSSASTMRKPLAQSARADTRGPSFSAAIWSRPCAASPRLPSLTRSSRRAWRLVRRRARPSAASGWAASYDTTIARRPSCCRFNSKLFHFTTVSLRAPTLHFRHSAALRVAETRRQHIPDRHCFGPPTAAKP